MTRWICLLLVGTYGVAHAQMRAGGAYTITTDTTGHGGGRSTATLYANTCTIGGITGNSSATTPVVITRQGHVGQLFEVVSIQPTASPSNILEDQSGHLSATLLLDDATTASADPSSIAWSVQGGPISSISSSGLASAASVFADTQAIIQAAYAGLASSLNVTVLDSISDNYGLYAADGVTDSWQVQFFGESNPLGRGDQDPDHDGHSNFFEFHAGLLPDNPTSKFLQRVEPVPGQPSQLRIVFSPRLMSRAYTIMVNDSLASAGWAPLTGAIVNDVGDERTVTVSIGGADRRFYKVLIEQP